MNKLDDYEVEFIEYTGLKMQGDGLPQIAGCIFGLLVLSEAPISFSEIVETLKVSRASVSTNTRLLESLGVAERVSLIGERQDHFRLPKNPYSRLMEGFSGRMQNYVESLNETLAKAPIGCFTRCRLENHQEFYQSAIENFQVLIDDLQTNK